MPGAVVDAARDEVREGCSAEVEGKAEVCSGVSLVWPWPKLEG